MRSIKNIRKYLLVICYFLVCTNVMADDESLKKQINDIKRDSKYLYADAVASSETEAHNLAEEILKVNIDEWINGKKKFNNTKKLVVANKKELWSALSMPRGNMYRSFIYVKKTDILPVENADVINSNNNSGESKIEELPPSQNLPSVVKKVSECTKYIDMINLLKDKQKNEEVTHFARYSQLENSDIYYLAIYNRDGDVVAVLTSGKDRINVRTGKPDSVTNYSGHGAIGFRVKE